MTKLTKKTAMFAALMHIYFFMLYYVIHMHLIVHQEGGWAGEISIYFIVDFVIVFLVSAITLCVKYDVYI